MKPFFKQTFKFLAFFAVTVLLFWLVYRDQDPAELLKVLREDVDYTWIWIAIVLGLFSHISRALRWQLLTDSMGYSISLSNSFMGVMIGYFANMAIPRMGEFTRCGVVSKYEDVPFSKLLGTVAIERVFDVVMLLLLTLIVVFGQFGQMVTFFNTHEGISGKISSLFSSGWFWGILAGFVVVCVGVLWIYRTGKLSGRIHHFLTGIKEGFLAFLHVKKRWLFIFYTVFIWVMYYLMLYVCFFCFDFTSGLNPLVGLTVFVLSSYGMVAPVQGGIGAWHFMVVAALMLYLPNTLEIESLSKTFALLTHGTMTLLYIVLGVLCLLYLPVYNARRKKS